MSQNKREYGIYSDRYFPSKENWQLHHIFVVDVDNPSVYVHFCEEHEREVEETVKNDECFLCRLLKNEDSTITRVIKQGTNEDWYIAEYPKSVSLRQLQEIVKWFNAKYNANCKSYFVN